MKRAEVLKTHLRDVAKYGEFFTLAYKCSLGERDAAGLSDQLFVMQHWRVPLQLQEVEQLPHFFPGAEHQLLVADGQTSGLAGRLALAEHGLHRTAPLGQAVPVAGQVEARDGHLEGGGQRTEMSSWSRRDWKKERAV